MCCNSDGITRSSPQGTAVPTAHFAVCHDYFLSVVLSLPFPPETDSPTTLSQALDLQSSLFLSRSWHFGTHSEPSELCGCPPDILVLPEPFTTRPSPEDFTQVSFAPSSFLFSLFLSFLFSCNSPRNYYRSPSLSLSISSSNLGFQGIRTLFLAPYKV